MGILDDIFNSITDQSSANPGTPSTWKNMVASGQATGTGATGPVESVGGTLLNAVGTEMFGYSHLAQGEEQQTADEFQAAQLRQNAGQAMAAGEANAVDIQRQISLISSRALAVAAANGGGASSPSVITNLSRIAGEGAYRQSLAIYGGQTQSQHDLLQAEGDDYSGNMALSNAKSIFDASQLETMGTLYKADAIASKNASTVMSGGSSLYSRFSGGGPPNSTNTDSVPNTGTSPGSGNSIFGWLTN